MADDPRLLALADKQDMSDILALYCRGCDRADLTALRACFFPDAHTTQSGFDGKSHDFCDFIISTVEVLDICTHMISNILIDLRGDVAVSECRFLAHHCWSDPGGRELHRFVEGRYLDRFEKREGVWKIARRRGLNEFNRIFSAWEFGEDQLSAAELHPAILLGAKAPDDWLYRMLDEA